MTQTHRNTRTSRALSFATVALAALVAVTASPRVADACGPYTPEGFVEYTAQWLFDGAVTPKNRAIAYPKLSKNELAMLALGDKQVAKTRWSRVDGKRASALVEVRYEVPACRSLTPAKHVKYFKVKLEKTDRYNWQPTAVQEAPEAEVAMLKLADSASGFTVALMKRASNVLAAR